MCGITGWVDYDRDLSRERDLLRRMTNSLVRRGPDAAGVWTDRHAGLGHRRLSIIDPVGGEQPMVSAEPGGTVSLTYCGEVYNFADIRQELLSRGHRFSTRSDTEVVLRGYLEWGTGVVDHLTGMYAFGVWDGRTEELLLVRDRMGVKPLYYAMTRRGLIFGSEIKALLANPAVPRRVDRDGLCEIFDMVKTPGHAVFADVHELRPGHLATFSRRGFDVRRYWALEAIEHTHDEETTVATVRELLGEAVREQLVSDVPLCSLLSGGLDSSAVSALAAEALGDDGPLRSFAVDFAHNATAFTADAVRGSADAPFARALADHIGAQHSEVLLDSAELGDPQVRAAVLAATDLPPTYWGDMWPSLLLLFRAVREQSTVALSGESADELFGGYRWFHNPAAVRHDGFPWLTGGSSRYFGGSTFFDQGFLDKIDCPGYRAGRYDEALAEVPVLSGESEPDATMRRLTYLNLTRFVQTLLDRNDRMSMAASLEVRVPFCDHRLTQYVFNVPWRLKVADGREKSLLRAAVGDLLPDEVRNRKKSPYPATQDPGYERTLRGELEVLLADSNAPVLPLLDVDKARTYLGRPERAVSQPYERGGLEMALWLNSWLTRYDVSLDI